MENVLHSMTNKCTIASLVSLFKIGWGKVFYCVGSVICITANDVMHAFRDALGRLACLHKRKS
jgi:hypothetical protein